MTLTASYAGASETFGLTVNPSTPAALSGISVSASTIVGGQSATGTVSLTSAAGSAGAVVSLSSSNAAAKVPASVTVPAGATSATFSVTTVSVTAATPVTLTASYNGISKTTSVTVSSYTYWRTVTIAHGQVPNTNQTNFPLLFNTTDPLLKTVANGGHVNNASGYDIIFTSDAAGTKKLNHEIEFYKGSTGQLIAWVQIPTLSHTADTVIYLFYGNPGITTSQQNKSGVWDANFIGVYHMADDAASTLVTDSTGSNNAAARANTNTKTTTGKIDGALRFNGASDYATVAQNGHFNLHASPFTLEAWVEDNSSAATLNSAFHRIISWYDGVHNIQLGLGDDSTATKRCFYIMNASASAIPNDTTTGNAANGLNHVVATYDGVSAYHVYLNGANADGGISKPGNQTAFTGNSTTLYLAERGDGFGLVKGTLDEIRISKMARSSDWIAAEFHNQSSPSTFYSVGSEK